MREIGLSVLYSIVASLTLVSSIVTDPAVGQTTNYIVDQFDADTTGLYLNQHWGTAVPTVTWDDTTNAISNLGPNNPGSGSAQWVVPWPMTGDQIEVTRLFNAGAILDLTNFSIVSFDIKFASNSATDGAGSYGAIEVDAIAQSIGWPSNTLAIYTSAVANGNGWIHVRLPVNAMGHPELHAVSGIGFKIQQSRTGGNLKGTTIFWLDNIIFSGYTMPPVTGPPQIIQLNPVHSWQMLEFQITNVPAASNPFDPDLIRLDATFTSPSGKSMVVPAFWYQGYTRMLSGSTEYDTVSGPPQWRLRFTPPDGGTYSLSLAIQTNNVPFATIVTNFMVVPNASSARFGYVSISTNGQYFETGDGRALPLIGEDVAWPSSRGTYDYDSWFAAMQNAGENFARVWMWPASFGIEDGQNTLNNYALDPAWQLDYVLQSAEQKGIYIQLTLDYHGMFAAQPDYWGGNNYWPENPYNITNGGPCITPEAFFTNATARIIYQKRLRYLVARYGYSQNLLAWEFFNEIDNDYSFLNATDVAIWHSAMGNWLQANDPYHHLITTSCTYARQHPELWSLPQISYCSEHAYNEPDPVTAIAGNSRYYLSTFGKPIMIGEFGTSWQGWAYDNNDPYLRGFREGIWGGALGGSVGTAMSWYWQNIDSGNHYPVYAALRKILNKAGWGTGLWTNIVFQDQITNAVGLSGSHQALVYLIAADAAWPIGATNALLPVQQGQTVILTKWAPGIYYADWYDPATALSLGSTQATASGGKLSLPLPNFTVDLAGIIYPPPTLTLPKMEASDTFQFQLNSMAGGIYVIEKSTNLSDWVPFLNVTNVQGTMNILDSDRFSNSVKCYRARKI